jgi:hypothetical protein
MMLLALIKFMERYPFRDDTNFIFAHLPVKDKTYFISEVINCFNAKDPRYVMKLNDIMFSMNVTQLSERKVILEAVKSIDLDSYEIKHTN